MNPSIEFIDFHGIEALRLTAASGASTVVSRFGAQVLSWVTRDGRERLFVSDRARFDGSIPIRGGIPVCFPQFGGLGSLPKHGLVRTRAWTISGQSCADGYAMASFEITDDETTRALWPHAFRAELTVVIEGDRLDVELAIDNTGDAPFTFTGALHTYLRVTEVEDSALAGLYGCVYRDAAKGDRMAKETSPELLIEDEMDRVYHDAVRPLLLKAGNFSLGIASEGFPDVVVWNPWLSAANFIDLGPSDFRRFLCVEAAVVNRPATIAAGEGWCGRQSLVVV